MKVKLNKFLGIFNLRMVYNQQYLLSQEAVSEYDRFKEYVNLISKSQHKSELLELMALAKSQLGQDLFVVNELKCKENGFFVEFGATNGITLSNTHLLEKQFGWKGILAEPAKCWHAALNRNRDAHIVTDCVWSDSNSILNFNEVGIAELSTIDTFSSSDLHKESRKKGRSYQVKTISLLDLLDKYNAPRIIDFLSIDTEGSEYAILENFDFEKYSFRVITCEHNFTDAREKIFSLLTSKGYTRKFEDISKFDDWYVKGE